MKHVILAFCFVLICGTNIWAQSFQKTENGIRSRINLINIEISFYSPSIVRVLKWQVDKIPVKESLSVVMKPSKTDLKTRQAGNVVSLVSTNMSVALDLGTGNVSFSNAKGTPLLLEKKTESPFTDFNDAGVQTYSVQQAFALDRDEAIYGLGQQQQGKMIQRNLKLNMIQG